MLIHRVSLFGLAGVASNSINILVFWICINFFGFSPFKSGTGAYFAGMLIGFYMNHKITFKGESKVSRRLLSYIFIQVFIYFIYSFLNINLIENSDYFAIVWHVILILICAFLNFCMTNYLWTKYAKT